MALIDEVVAIVARVREEFAPDPRLEVFEVDVEEADGVLTLSGATSEPAAVEALHRRIGVLDGDTPVRDLVERLPDADVGERPFALVSAAIAPFHSTPFVAEATLTHSVLGQRLAVLRRRGRWLQCRAPDGYIGWVHRGYLHRVDDVEATEWEVAAGGEPCVSLGGAVLSDDGEVLALLPWGARVVCLPDGRGRLPDGTEGRLVGEMVRALERPERFPADGEAVVATAVRWIGAPYLWGGITPAGVDCSGLVQAVYRLHGVELPRDSDQQARAGAPLDPGPDFSALRPGDLLFFAEEANRISHVTLSLGGSRIIHSSLGNGGVRRNDLLGELGYEKELRRLFVSACRVLPATGG